MRFLLLAILLVACGPRVETRFYKAGSTDAEWKRDSYECARDSSMVVTDHYRYVTESRLAVDSNMFGLCLEARGWERRVEPRRRGGDSLGAHPLLGDPKH